MTLKEKLVPNELGIIMEESVLDMYREMCVQIIVIVFLWK